MALFAKDIIACCSEMKLIIMDKGKGPVPFYPRYLGPTLPPLSATPLFLFHLPAINKEKPLDKLVYVDRENVIPRGKDRASLQSIPECQVDRELGVRPEHPTDPLQDSRKST